PLFFRIAQTCFFGLLEGKATHRRLLWVKLLTLLLVVESVCFVPTAEVSRAHRGARSTWNPFTEKVLPQRGWKADISTHFETGDRKADQGCPLYPRSRHAH